MWWGLTPALDVAEQCNSTDLNVLLVAQSDCRHVLKTLSQRYRYSEFNTVKLYVYEPRIENIGRSLLFLTIALDEQLAIGPKSQYFMDLYGNTLIRQASFQYLTDASSRLVKLVTNFNYLSKLFPSISLDNLKYKERDQLENVFKHWATGPDVDILKNWDSRVRSLLGTRYDSRIGAVDWDLHMRYRPYGAESLSNQEYKCFREKGVAFLLNDTDPSIPNLTLSSFSAGAPKPSAGYFGDITTGPFPAFGFESDNKDLLKKCNGQVRKTATEITEWNLQKLFHEIAYSEPFEPPKDDLNSGQLYRQDCVSQLKIQRAEWRKKFEGDSYSSILTPGTEIIFLPLNALKDYPGKPQFQDFFDLVTVPQHLVNQLPYNWGVLCKPGARVVVESSKYALNLRKEDLVKAKVELDNAMKNVSCEQEGDFDYKINNFIHYKFVK